ncbi:PilZ domain-containing protein [Bowmanella sp. JS7-9]|uniref:Flagellar brake domain-containing protein n=1 Tax=Pseudobowmanella zhangzhouensis TaxID=1537679 RepID=A0ABW1XN22_9ALTE|nr:PilZ domain-containing protein [Bowmanella sp. JS7-9]
MLETHAKPFVFHISHFIVGQWLDIEIENYLPTENDRYKARFVGGSQSGYLLVEQPDARRYGMLRNSIRDQGTLIIRAISEGGQGECIAFKADITGTINHPQRLIAVAFPNDIERRELRKEKRHLTDIPAQIRAPGSTRLIDCTIVDISSGGCRVECNVGEKVIGLKLKQIDLLYDDPASGEPRCKQATVRSDRKQGSLLMIGMSFDELD